MLNKVDGIYHCHITIPGDTDPEVVIRAAKLAKGKVTEIEYQTGDMKPDIMITAYYQYNQLRGDSVPEHWLSKVTAFVRSVVEPTRVKMELEVATVDRVYRNQMVHAIASASYVETHIKFKIPNRDGLLDQLRKDIIDSKWYPSKNPRRVSATDITQYASRRYAIDKLSPEMGKIVQKARTEADFFIKMRWQDCVEQIQIELAVYDSNVDHDKQWSEQYVAG